jgi:hypothetical protein
MNSVKSRTPDFIDAALSIVKDSERRNSLCNVVPKVKVAPLKNKLEVTFVRGPPTNEEAQQYGDYVYLI